MHICTHLLTLLGNTSVEFEWIFGYQSEQIEKVVVYIGEPHDVLLIKQQSFIFLTKSLHKTLLKLHEKIIRKTNFSLTFITLKPLK